MLSDQIRNMLHGIIDRATGDEDAIRKALATWFDNAMDRVSGAYKRTAQFLVVRLCSGHRRCAQHQRH